jgi:hypothetical protein
MNTQELITNLKNRFSANMIRHKGIEWKDVEARILNNPKAISTLIYMEETKGEPDVIGVDETTKKFQFVDCSKQSPAGRRSYCYDAPARLGRKKFPPLTSAVEEAEKNGLTLIDETIFRKLKTFGDYDTTTSSWLKTPQSIRSLGGAIFGNIRYDAVFIYHNGADSYYADRGYRGLLLV